VHAYLREKIDLDLPKPTSWPISLCPPQRQYSNMLMQGMSKEQIEEQMDQLGQFRRTGREQLKMYFIMDKLAEKYEVEVTEEEINGHIAYIAAMRGRRPEKMREELARDGSLAQFTLQIREEKCIEKLETAKITEVEAGQTKAAKNIPLSRLQHLPALIRLNIRGGLGNFCGRSILSLSIAAPAPV
jgi:trigger factor